MFFIIKYLLNYCVLNHLLVVIHSFCLVSNKHLKLNVLRTKHLSLRLTLSVIAFVTRYW